jgi:glycosyltransferase involved in cell wall biosynthesis
MFGSPPPGQEAYLERCRGLAAELGISDVATFEGRVAQIRDAYKAGQVYVLCSIAEGFPYTVIEAMTCGRPCVATDVGGVNEAVADTGIVVPPRSPESLAQACLTLLRDAPQRRRLGAAARMRALEYFTVDRAISAFDEIYTFVGTGLELPSVELLDDESDDLVETELPERDEETQLLEAAG